MVKKPVKKPAKILVGKDDSESKIFALIGVLLTVIGFAIVMLARKEDKYAIFYAKQGLVLFIAWVMVWLASGILSWIPIAGEIMAWALNAIMVGLWIVGIVYSVSGEEKDIPVIGQFAKKL